MSWIADCPACRSMDLAEKFFSGDRGELELAYVCRNCGEVFSDDSRWHDVPDVCAACAAGEHETLAFADCECPCHPQRKPMTVAPEPRERRAFA